MDRNLHAFIVSELNAYRDLQKNEIQMGTA